jgi:hypothetical protein
VHLVGFIIRKVFHTFFTVELNRCEWPISFCDHFFFYFYFFTNWEITLRNKLLQKFWNIFIYCLSSDTPRSLDYIVSNDKMDNVSWNRCGEISRDLTLGAIVIFPWRDWVEPRKGTILYHEIPHCLLEIYGCFAEICHLHFNRSRFLGNFGKFVPDYTPSHFRRFSFGHGGRNLRISHGLTFLTFHIDFAYALNIQNLFCFWRDSPQRARTSSFMRFSRSQTTTHHSR